MVRNKGTHCVRFDGFSWFLLRPAVFIIIFLGNHPIEAWGTHCRVDPHPNTNPNTKLNPTQSGLDDPTAFIHHRLCYNSILQGGVFFT